MTENLFNCFQDSPQMFFGSGLNLNRNSESTSHPQKHFKCQFCSKILSSKQNLKEHQFIHTGEKPYSCREPGCQMKFRQGSQLSAHKRIHAAIKNCLQPPTPFSDTQSTQDGETFKVDSNSTLLPPITGPKFECVLPNVFE